MTRPRYTLLTAETKAGVVTPEDEAVLAAAQHGTGVVVLNGDQLRELAVAARAAMARFAALAVEIMTEERAAFVRKLRVDRGCSWRAVAAECSDTWQGTWYPPSNQLMGIALCEAAALLLHQDANAEPWN